MALFGLFGKKDKKDEADNKESAYFLDQDSAKTFGDIDYMRTPKAVKKTFPTVNGVKGAEIVVVATASEMMIGDEMKPAANNQDAQSVPQPKTFEPNKSNARVDSGMDIFLNMAKDIKKR
jgi:hypothetical protein